MIAIRASVLITAVCLSACATPDPQYAAYIRFAEQQAQAEQERFASLAKTAEQCEDNRCVEHVAAVAALAQVSGHRGLPVQPFVKQYHPAWGILSAAVPQLIGNAASIYQAKYANETARRQWDVLGEALSATRINVGGDYVTGSQHIGDAVSVGADYVSGTQHLGDAIGGDRVDVGGSQHLGDAIGGDRIDVVGDDNRIDSPGPFDNDGGPCVAGNGAVGGTGGIGGEGGTGTTAPGGDGAPGAPGGTGGNCIGGPGG